mmetsp:Transcript_14396/g.25325  ORF Transcript_14396/g.25325 Transcript_14396/m.25325 type:complete len:82 (-) Transcript_14396:43-288(-)
MPGSHRWLPQTGVMGCISSSACERQRSSQMRLVSETSCSVLDGCNLVAEEHMRPCSKIHAVDIAIDDCPASANYVLAWFRV